MLLYIAEKPSLGRAIAAALPAPIEKGPGWLRCGKGDEAVVVSWCIGHLLEPAEPGHYDSRWQQWRLQDLPLFPDQWALTPRDSGRQQLDTLVGLIRKATTIIHAGDPDREGQLLVDEVIRYAGARCPIQRLLINDLTPRAVSRALGQLQDNRQFRHLSHSALARQRADWLYGINLTRLYTLTHRKPGEKGVYSVGRVQTPVLGLVVNRDNTIANFEPRPFFRVKVHCHPLDHDATQPFTARWLVDEAYREHLDSEDRLLDGEVARRIASAVEGRPGTINEARFRDRKEAPPLPLSLSVLQIEAGRLYQMGAKEVLDCAQSLYERHQLITYPRSDCRYLPEDHLRQAPTVIDAIANVAKGLAPLTASADPGRQSAAWNNRKVGAHHAIIPTARNRPSGALSEREGRIYELISRYYLMQFYTDAVHREGRLTLTIGDHQFRASETGVTTPGWKTLEIRQRDKTARPDNGPLPRLEAGDSVLCNSSEVTEHKTQPPLHFTDATLLSAMTNIARFVSDPVLRKTLRETDGLGTEATRASIIETLFKRAYLYRDSRHIRATAKGLALIDTLPAEVSQPDMTAIWEANLEQIRQGEGDPKAFMAELRQQINRILVGPAPSRKPSTPDGATSIHCPKCRAPMIPRTGKYGEFHACSRFPDCNGTRAIEVSTPTDGTGQKPVPCPHCYSPLVRRKGKKGWFWGCSNYPGCRQTVDDADGQPVLKGV